MLLTKSLIISIINLLKKEKINIPITETFIYKDKIYKIKCNTYQECINRMEEIKEKIDKLIYKKQKEELEAWKKLLKNIKQKYIKKEEQFKSNKHKRTKKHKDPTR